MQKPPRSTNHKPRHHLVVLREPYLGRMLAGRKRIECRLSSQFKPPFSAVVRGDMLWIKPPCLPIRAVASVDRCEFWPVSGAAELERRIQPHKPLIAAEAEFWRELGWVKYVSLIWINDVLSIEPIPVIKRDRRAWVVLEGPPRPHAAV